MPKSYFDRSKTFTKDQWAVTLICAEGGHHAQIVIEGIDEDNGNTFCQMAHFIGPYSTNPSGVGPSLFHAQHTSRFGSSLGWGKIGIVKPFKNINPKKIRLHSFKTWLRDISKIESMMEHVNGSAGVKHRFSIFGSESWFNHRGVRTCLRGIFIITMLSIFLGIPLCWKAMDVVAPHGIPIGLMTLEKYAVTPVEQYNQFYKNMATKFINGFNNYSGLGNYCDPFMYDTDIHTWRNFSCLLLTNLELIAAFPLTGTFTSLILMATIISFYRNYTKPNNCVTWAIKELRIAGIDLTVDPFFGIITSTRQITEVPTNMDIDEMDVSILHH